MKKYIRSSEIIAESLYDELVMLDIDKGKYYALNQVGSSIWKLLEQPLSVEELCDKLVEEFKIDPRQCREEIKEYIGKLHKLGLILEY